MDEFPNPNPNHQSVAKTEYSTTAQSPPPKPSPLLQIPVTIGPSNSQQSKPQLAQSPLLQIPVTIGPSNSQQSKPQLAQSQLQTLETQRLLQQQQCRQLQELAQSRLLQTLETQRPLQQQQYRQLQEQVNGNNLRMRFQGSQMNPPSMSILSNQMKKNGDVDSQLGMMTHHQDLLSQKNYSQILQMQNLYKQQSQNNQLLMMKQIQLGDLVSQKPLQNGFPKLNDPGNDVVAGLKRRMKEQDARIDELKIRQRELWMVMVMVICVLMILFMILWVHSSV